MGALTRWRLARLRYRRETDVRGVPHWPEATPVLLITGKSGTGKTWQLGRLLEACAEAPQIATLVSAGRGTEDILARASRDAWQSGLGETSDKSLRAVSHFVRDIAPDTPVPLLTVAVDDIQDVDLARDLVRQDWADWGIRLVLTVPLTVAQALQLTDGEALHVHYVSDFSVDELDALLKQHGRRWLDLHPDLKKLLRSPILAGLFLDLPYASFQSAPRSEYEIFEGFWQRIIARGRPGDEGIVMALAAHMSEGKPYPLPRPAWHEIGLTDDGQLVRLEAAGWLRRVEGDEVAFAHERLLNWAVAKSLVRKFQRRELSVENLGALLAGESDGQARRFVQRLGYVPMDALWLLAADRENSEKLGRLIVQLEDNREFGSYGEHLYVRLLPTLGQRAVPLLLERLGALTSGSDGDYRVGLIGEAFAGLALQEGVELEEAVDSLLTSPTRDRQAVAIATLTSAPNARYLDRLWKLHQQRLDAVEDKADVSRHRDYQASFAALRTGIELAPEWLRHRILASDAEREPVSELAYLLNGLEHRDAPAIWQATSNVLMAKVSAGKPRSLLYCIARFSDREKLDFVVKHLSRSEDFASGAALAALAVLDPVMAIDRLIEVEDAERSLTRNQWLPVLLRVQPDLTRQRVREFAETDAKGRRLIEELFWERPDELDEEMLRFLLRALEADLREHFDAALAGEPIWLFHPLDFLGRIAHPDLLAVLEAEAGGELEHMITAVACSRSRNNSINRDHVRESARRVLILIGGEGITTLINRELESEHIWVRLGGLNWAFVRADGGTIERLAAIARRPVPRDGNGRLESHPYREFCQAMSALAALGADAILVEILWNSDMAEVPVDLAGLRAHQGPMPKALTEPALQILESADSAEDALVIALTIAWLSGDAALIPARRAVFERIETGKPSCAICLHRASSTWRPFG